MLSNIKVFWAATLDILLLTILWFSFMVIFTMIGVIGQKISHSGNISNLGLGPISNILFGISTLYLAIIALWFLRGRELVFNQIKKADALQILFSITAGFCLFTITLGISYLLDKGGAPLKPSNQELLDNLSKKWPVTVAVFTIFVAPIFEELFFRKQLFVRFVNAGKIIWGYVVSSVLFALMHEPSPKQGIGRWLIILGLYALMGGVFARVYQKTGRLKFAIIAHASNNFFVLLGMLRLS